MPRSRVALQRAAWLDLAKMAACRIGTALIMSIEQGRTIDGTIRQSESLAGVCSNAIPIGYFSGSIGCSCSSVRGSHSGDDRLALLSI